MPRLLIVDDDHYIHRLVDGLLDETDIETFSAEDAATGLQQIREHDPDVVLLDIMLPGTSGLEVFHEIHADDPRRPVIFITALSDSDTAIDAMQLGAFDYVPKPLDLPALQAVIEEALRSRRLMCKPVALQTGAGTEPKADPLVGRSPAMLDVYKRIGRIAANDVTVLITGESGSGKELVARAVYQHSPRVGKPFLAVNCAALPDTLLESELFGHEKGAFTGAERRRIGKFEQCSGGTLFLDEIGDMSPLVQSKVLRLLQEQRFERVGGNCTIETDVRILAATNRDLEAMVGKGTFRADLLYRLNGFCIDLPPLRERREDIPQLTQHLLSQFCQEPGRREIEGLADETLAALVSYDWPGNVRELQSVVRQMVLNATGPVLTPDCLPEDVISSPESRYTANRARPDGNRSNRNSTRKHDADLNLFVEQRLAGNSNNLYNECLEVMERFVISRVLDQTAGNRSQAAELLGITRGKIRDRIARFDLEKRPARSP